MAPFVRWAGLHALRRGPRNLHVITKGARDVVDCSAVVELLKDDGVVIARRTVAKYREAMGILPSSKRKRLF